jgi:hypothetical protein
MGRLRQRVFWHVTGLETRPQREIKFQFAALQKNIVAHAKARGFTAR